MRKKDTDRMNNRKFGERILVFIMPHWANLRNKNILEYFVLWINNEIHTSSCLSFNTPYGTVGIN